MNRGTLLGPVLVVALVASVLLGTWVVASRERPGPTSTADVWVEPRLTAAQVAAFASLTPGAGVPPEVTHPPEGGVVPATFPAPRLLWTDEYASRVYRVEVREGGEGAVLWTAYTQGREVTPPLEAWTAWKARTTRLGVTVTSAGVEPDGRVISSALVSSPAIFTIAPVAESPQGMLLFGMKHRPANRPIGTVSLLEMHLRIDALDLEHMEHRVVFRSSSGPEPTVIHPGRREQERAGPPESPEHPDPSEFTTSTQCVSCHAISNDGRYVAVFSQTAEESPPTFDAPNGFLTVLTMPERKAVLQLPHAFMPQFHPKDSSLLVFGEVDETIGTKDQMMVRKSDLRVANLRTGAVRDVPGANDPGRVENFPYWSPDGTRLVFIRTKPGQLWHGAAGLLDLATVTYDPSGNPAEAQPLRGASDNGKSNFLPVYSPDGRWIVFTQADQGFFSQQSSDLWIVPAEGGTARRLECNGPHTESWHRFSPDGRWLALVTNREDVRRPHIYLSRFDTTLGTAGPAVQLPVVAGPGAHTHAFSWTDRFGWITEYELAR